MKTFADALRVLMAFFPKFDLTPEQAAAWGSALADVDPEALCTAALHLSHESSYAPTIHEWRTRALTASGKGDALEMGAGEAWDAMRKHRTRYSQTRYNATPYQPQWESEAVRRASEAVDWTNSEWQTEQIPTIRAQFERYYNSIKGKQATIDASNDAAALMPGVMRSIGRGDGPRPLIGGDS